MSNSKAPNTDALLPELAKIHGELADLSTVVGDHDAATHHRARADWFTARPEMRLHFELFQFPALLTRLPLVVSATGAPDHR